MGQHLLGAEAAVEADGVGVKSFEDGGDAVDVGAGEELSVAAEGDGREDRQVAVLLCGEHCGLKLVCVGHRLDCHEVGACLRAGGDLLCEGVVGGVELEVARRLEEASRGAYVECHEAFPAVVRALRARRLLRDGDSCHDDVGERRVAVVFSPVGAERVRVDDVGAGFKVRFMDRPDVRRPRKVPQFRGLAGPQPFFLQLRAHRPVEKRDAAAQYVG